MAMNTASLFFLPLLTLVCLDSVDAASLQGAASGWKEVPDFKRALGSRMAYDWHRKKIVRFGGGSRILFQQVGKQHLHRNDTWEWSGGKWVCRQPLHRPAPRSLHGMAYDPISKRVILFGGSDLLNIFADTWAWDGQDWTKLSPKSSPTARIGPSMATDPVRGRLVLFGGGLGFDGIGKGGLRPQSDTWEWDGKNWIARFPKTVPDPRAQGLMSYSPVSKAIVLTEGHQSFPWNPPSKTWEWDGTDWKKFDTIPGGVEPGSLVTDWRKGQVLKLSALGFPVAFSARYWTGKAWQLVPWKYTPAVSQPRMASDPHSRLVLLFGAVLTGRVQNSHDTASWTFDGTSWRAVDQWRTYDSPSHIVHDAARDEFLLLGDAETGNPNLFVWRIKQDRVERISSKNEVPWRRGFSALYHPGLKKVWLFGGQLTRYTWSQEIWTWDGTDWAKLPSKNPPPIQWGSPTVTNVLYFPPRDVVLVTLSDKTIWEWSQAGGWKKISMNGFPGLRHYEMAYDVRRKRIVLWGGDATYTTNIAQTWEWDGLKWLEVKTRTKPPIRFGPHMEYVSSMQGVMMFAGQGGATSYPRDAWFFDGKDWSKITDKAFPVDRWHIVGAAYDVGRQRIRVFQSSLQSVSRMSEFRLPTMRASQPYPRPGQAIQLLTSLPRMAGAPVLYTLAWSDRPGIPLRHVPGLGTELLPLAPDALLVMSLQMGLVTLLDAKGQASMSMSIPAQTSMVGLRFHAAAVAFTKTLGVGAITSDVVIEVVK